MSLKEHVEDPLASGLDPPLHAISASNAPVVAIGIGGRVEFRGGEVRIVKNTAIGHIFDLLWPTYGVMEKRIPLSHVTSVEIVRPLIFPDFIRLTYAGSPPQTGRYLRDALAENALIMNMFDNRSFYDVRDRIARSAAAGQAEAAQV